MPGMIASSSRRIVTNKLQDRTSRPRRSVVVRCHSVAVRSHPPVAVVSRVACTTRSLAVSASLFCLKKTRSPQWFLESGLRCFGLPARSRRCSRGSRRRAGLARSRRRSCVHRVLFGCMYLVVCICGVRIVRIVRALAEDSRIAATHVKPPGCEWRCDDDGFVRMNSPTRPSSKWMTSVDDVWQRCARVYE